MKKKNKLIDSTLLFYLLSFTWGIIWTLVGLFALLGTFIFLNKKQRTYQVIKGRVVVYLPYTNFGGVSLGIVVIVSQLHPSLIKHELGHTIQSMLFGPLFIFLVAIPSGIRYQLFDWLSRRHYYKYGLNLDYDSAWFEGQATRLGNVYFSEFTKENL